MFHPVFMYDLNRDRQAELKKLSDQVRLAQNLKRLRKAAIKKQ